jgi:hypothetical protein
MDEREILLREYNNLWNEKLIHKQAIRKFHNYLTYITAIGSLTLIFYGTSFGNLLRFGANPDLVDTVVHLFLIALTPVLIVILTFPLNDIYHIYVMANQVRGLEGAINERSNDVSLLTWESEIVPVAYGGKEMFTEQGAVKLSNVISVMHGYYFQHLQSYAWWLFRYRGHI